MADLSKIKLPSGTEYDIKDATARSMISSLNQFTYKVVSTLPTAASTTMYKIYLKAASTAGTDDNYEEYITIDKGSSADPRYVWEKLGTITSPDLSDYVSKAEAGALAYKSSASGSGSVAVPKTYTTSTTVATTEDKSVSVTGTTTGSVSLTKSTVDVKPNTTGTAANKYTPSGSVSSSFTGTSSSGTISGTAAAQTISVKTAGATTTVNSITAVGTLPSCTLPTYTVSGETLTITGGSFSAGTLPTKGANTTVKTGDAAYQAASSTVSGSCAVTPSGSVSSSFSGDSTYLKTAVEVGTAASFSGASMTATGSVSVPKTFTSSTETATTENKTVSVTVS